MHRQFSKNNYSFMFSYSEYERWSHSAPLMLNHELIFQENTRKEVFNTPSIRAAQMFQFNWKEI